MFARIRSGRGLGDALYLQSIVRYLVRRGETLEVCTDYPELYRFRGMVRFAAWSRQVHYTCHYTRQKGDERTTQFVDMHRNIGIKGPVPLHLDWIVQNPKLVEGIRQLAGARPVLFVHGGREAFGRSDGFGRALLPDAEAFRGVLAKLRERFFTVYVGNGKRLFEVETDLDLNGKTSITDLIDIAYAAADAFFAQASFAIPLAESFDKRILVMFAARGFKSHHQAVRTITPKKLLHKMSSTYNIDNWDYARTQNSIDQFCEPRARGGVVCGETGGDCGECALGIAQSGIGY